MPIQYNTPPSLGTIASSDVTFVNFDILHSTAVIGVIHYDAGGNIITTETVSIPNVPGATITAVKNAAFNRLMALRGAGTVT